MFRNGFVRNDVGNRGPAADFKNAEKFCEKLTAVDGLDKIQNAVRNNAIDRVAFDHWLFSLKRLFEISLCEDFLDTGGFDVLHFFFVQFQIESEILDHAAAKRNNVVANFLSDLTLVLSGQAQHFLIAIDTDDVAFGANNLSGDVAEFSSS